MSEVAALKLQVETLEKRVSELERLFAASGHPAGKSGTSDASPGLGNATSDAAPSTVKH